jgi:hypothetical protein
MGMSDKLVDARDILRAVMEVRRQSSGRLLQELETLEVDLAEFLMEELGNVHRQLLDLRATPKAVRRLTRRIESLAVVLVTALRGAQLRLWREDAAGTRLTDMDPTLSDATKAPDSNGLGGTEGTGGAEGDKGSAGDCA